MAAFLNKMNISGIEFYFTTKNYCPLGEDYYTANFSVALEPAKMIPDYDILERDLYKKINGKELSIEDAVNNVYELINEEYEPLYLSVVASVDDAGHFPVKVTKVSER